MYRAFITLGPEDSGNRMMQNILVAAGCQGQGGYEIPFVQALDDEIPQAECDIAWLRSVPHCGSFPDLVTMVRQVRAKGYEPHIIIMVRAAWIVCHAQVRSRNPESPEVAQAMVEHAYLRIFKDLNTLMKNDEAVPFHMAPHSELVREPRALKMFMDLLGLPTPKFEFRNGNEKYYEDRSGNSAV